MSTPGSLQALDADVRQGTPLDLVYAVDQAHASDLNWIGIWPDPGDGPVDGQYHGGQVVYAYAPGSAGTVTISSGVLQPGQYLAFYLYDNGYALLADPLPLTVATSPQLPPPGFRGDFGRTGRYLLDTPTGLCQDADGGFWVADQGSRQVVSFSRTGGGRSAFGSSVLREPQDVAVSTTHVYVADQARDEVTVFTRGGRHVGAIGHGQLGRPRGVALDGRGDVLVADVGGNRVARFDSATGRLLGAITADVAIPHGIAVHGDEIWVVSSSRQYDGNCGVTRYVDDAPTITLGYGQHSVFGALSNPAHVAVDPAGLVVVSVPDFGLVSRFRPTGPFIGEFGVEGAGLLRYPQGVVIGADGRIYVADTGNGRIAIFGGVR